MRHYVKTFTNKGEEDEWEVENKEKRALTKVERSCEYIQSI
jgi:hypothetical protein